MNRHIIASMGLLVLALSIGCHANKLSSCSSGQCDPAVVGGGCDDGSCQVAGTDVNGANANFLANGGRSGPLAGLHGRHHRGAQSHMGSSPGPAMGPAQPTYGYPYYTTRGPRDFLNPNPPSIGP